MRRSMSSISRIRVNLDTKTCLPVKQQSFRSYQRSCLRKSWYSRSSDGIGFGHTADSPRAYPSYSVYNQSFQMALKPILPTLQQSESGIFMEKSGRMLLEFSSRLDDGSNRFDYNSKEMIALSGEEMGMILNCAPGNDVEIKRSQIEGTQAPISYEGPIFKMSSPSKGYSLIEEESVVEDNIYPDIERMRMKLTVKLGADDCVLFELLSRRGFKNSIDMDMDSKVFTVEAQAGQFEVLKALFRNCIPFLSGAFDCSQFADNVQINSEQKKSPNSEEENSPLPF